MNASNNIYIYIYINREINQNGIPYFPKRYSLLTPK